MVSVLNNMAAKKPVKKKIQREPTIKFGDSVETPDQRKIAITLLLNGKQSEFWLLLSQVLAYNIKETERIILDEDSITHEERDAWRQKRYYQMELLNLPDVLLKQLLPDEKNKEAEELDPFD